MNERYSTIIVGIQIVPRFSLRRRGVPQSSAGREKSCHKIFAPTAATAQSNTTSQTATTTAAATKVSLQRVETRFGYGSFINIVGLFA